MIPFALMAMVDACAIFVIAIAWFRVPFRGSLLILFSMAIVFLVANLGLGLLNSAISRTQQEAQLVAFLLIMPSVLLSGFMFPFEGMPRPAVSRPAFCRCVACAARRANSCGPSRDRSVPRAGFFSSAWAS